MHPPRGRFHLDHTFYGHIAGGVRGTLLVNSLYMQFPRFRDSEEPDSFLSGLQDPSRSPLRKPRRRLHMMQGPLLYTMGPLSGLQDPLLCTAGLLWASGDLSRDLGTHFGNQRPSHTVWALLCMMVPSWGQGLRYIDPLWARGALLGHKLRTIEVCRGGGRNTHPVECQM